MFTETHNFFHHMISLLFKSYQKEYTYIIKIRFLNVAVKFIFPSTGMCYLIYRSAQVCTQKQGIYLLIKFLNMALKFIFLIAGMCFQIFKSAHFVLRNTQLLIKRSIHMSAYQVFNVALKFIFPSNACSNTYTDQHKLVLRNTKVLV